MKIKTTELQGAALDWAVAKCEGLEVYFEDGLVCLVGQPFDTYWKYWNPTTDWAQGGPIIERENINVFMDDEKWAAYASHSLPQNFYGTSKDADETDEGSPLIAAMRCYVASQLGEEVEVPDEIL